MLMEPGLTVFAALVALVAGFLIGRRTGKARERIGELESQLEVAGKERELAQASVVAAKEEIKRVEKELRVVGEERDLAQASLVAAKQEIERVETELQEYRADVVEHFTGTSGLLRDLTVQYRSVYDHLTKGATSLCPEGSVSLLEGLQAERLPAEAGPSGSARGEEGPEDETERSQAAPSEA
jgi:uncharacterized membrane-anchored protein YhcB (DUF1043 family)